MMHVHSITGVASVCIGLIAARIKRSNISSALLHNNVL